MLMNTTKPAPAADLLYGVAAIAGHLELSCKQVYHLHDEGDLPTFKVGGTVCARRSTLAKYFARLEREAR